MKRRSQSCISVFLAVVCAIGLLMVEVANGASLYWTDVRGVHRSDLDGQNPQTIVPVPINSIASMAIDEVEGKIYYADFSGSRILRSDLDGTNLENVIISRWLYLRSLVVDSSRRKIYWIHSDKIFRANLNGTDVEMIVQAWEPWDLVIDEENGKIYWLDRHPKSPPVLACANLDGSGQETVVVWDNPPLIFISPRAIAIDSIEQKIYFIRGGAIQRADTDGSNVEIVLDGLEKVDLDVNLAVDTNGRQLYWTDSKAGTLYRATLDGGNVETIVQQAKIGAITLHSAGEKIYWVDKMQGLTVHCANLDGSRRAIVLEVPLRNYRGIDVDEHEGKIYWTSLNSAQSPDRPEILRGNSDGSAVELLMATGLSRPTSIAVDGRGEKIYWVNSGNNMILRANLNGSAAEELVVHGKPRQIEVDGGSGKMYWIDASSGIHRANLDGTGVEVLIADIGNARGLGIDPLEQKIYWSVSNKQGLRSMIRMADFNGRNRETVVEARIINFAWTDIEDIEMDGIHKKIYWIDSRYGLIFRANLDGTNVETVISNLVEPKGITLDLTPDSVADVNRDGIVNIQDLVMIASQFGQEGRDGADVNRDGIIDILDLVLVAAAFENVVAAPPVAPQIFETLASEDVQQWLTDAKALRGTDSRLKRGISILEQLLAVLTERSAIPAETSLLPNYPNPFNPETWIPYQLAEPAEVTIKVYDENGLRVRELAVGHQPAGLYQSRGRAAYWNGRNQQGEPVASGMYFCTLNAGDFSATRKMLVKK